MLPRAEQELVSSSYQVANSRLMDIGLIKLGNCLVYPGLTYVQNVLSANDWLIEHFPDKSMLVKNLVDLVSTSDIDRIQEQYTQTFDLSPVCCLYPGYHLLGEDYARGMLMAGLKLEMRELGMDAGTELPDFLPLLIELFCRLNDQEKSFSLARDLILPGISIMRQKLNNVESPFYGVLTVLDQLIRLEAGIDELTQSELSPFLKSLNSYADVQSMADIQNPENFEGKL